MQNLPHMRFAEELDLLDSQTAVELQAHLGHVTDGLLDVHIRTDGAHAGIRDTITSEVLEMLQSMGDKRTMAQKRWTKLRALQRMGLLKVFARDKAGDLRHQRTLRHGGGSSRAAGVAGSYRGSTGSRHTHGTAPGNSLSRPKPSFLSVTEQTSREGSASGNDLLTPAKRAMLIQESIAHRRTLAKQATQQLDGTAVTAALAGTPGSGLSPTSPAATLMKAAAAKAKAAAAAASKPKAGKKGGWWDVLISTGKSLTYTKKTDLASVALAAHKQSKQQGDGEGAPDGPSAAAAAAAAEEAGEVTEGGGEPGTGSGDPQAQEQGEAGASPDESSSAAAVLQPQGEEESATTTPQPTASHGTSDTAQRSSQSWDTGELVAADQDTGEPLLLPPANPGHVDPYRRSSTGHAVVDGEAAASLSQGGFTGPGSKQASLDRGQAHGAGVGAAVDVETTDTSGQELLAPPPRSPRISGQQLDVSHQGSLEQPTPVTQPLVPAALGNTVTQNYTATDAGAAVQGEPVAPTAGEAAQDAAAGEGGAAAAAEGAAEGGDPGTSPSSPDESIAPATQEELEKLARMYRAIQKLREPLSAVHAVVIIQRAWRRFITSIEQEVDQQLVQEEEEDARAEAGLEGIQEEEEELDEEEEEEGSYGSGSLTGSSYSGSEDWSSGEEEGVDQSTDQEAGGKLALPRKPAPREYTVSLASDQTPRTADAGGSATEGLSTAHSAGSNLVAGGAEDGQAGGRGVTFGHAHVRHMVRSKTRSTPAVPGTSPAGGSTAAAAPPGTTAPPKPSTTAPPAKPQRSSSGFSSKGRTASARVSAEGHPPALPSSTSLPRQPSGALKSTRSGRHSGGLSNTGAPPAVPAPPLVTQKSKRYSNPSIGHSSRHNSGDGTRPSVPAEVGACSASGHPHSCERPTSRPTSHSGAHGRAPSRPTSAHASQASGRQSRPSTSRPNSRPNSRPSSQSGRPGSRPTSRPNSRPSSESGKRLSESSGRGSRPNSRPASGSSTARGRQQQTPPQQVVAGSGAGKHSVPRRTKSGGIEGQKQAQQPAPLKRSASAQPAPLRRAASSASLSGKESVSEGGNKDSSIKQSRALRQTRSLSARSAGTPAPDALESQASTDVATPAAPSPALTTRTSEQARAESRRAAIKARRTATRRRASMYAKMLPSGQDPASDAPPQPAGDAPGAGDEQNDVQSHALHLLSRASAPAPLMLAELDEYESNTVIPAGQPPDPFRSQSVMAVMEGSEAVIDSIFKDSGEFAGLTGISGTAAVSAPAAAGQQEAQGFSGDHVTDMQGNAAELHEGAFVPGMVTRDSMPQTLEPFSMEGQQGGVDCLAGVNAAVAEQTQSAEQATTTHVAAALESDGPVGLSVSHQLSGSLGPLRSQGSLHQRRLSAGSTLRKNMSVAGPGPSSRDMQRTMSYLHTPEHPVAKHLSDTAVASVDSLSRQLSKPLLGGLLHHTASFAGHGNHSVSRRLSLKPSAFQLHSFSHHHPQQQSELSRTQSVREASMGLIGHISLKQPDLAQRLSHQQSHLARHSYRSSASTLSSRGLGEIWNRASLEENALPGASQALQPANDKRSSLSSVQGRDTMQEHVGEHPQQHHQPESLGQEDQQQGGHEHHHHQGTTVTPGSTTRTSHQGEELLEGSVRRRRHHHRHHKHSTSRRERRSSASAGLEAEQGEGGAGIREHASMPIIPASGSLQGHQEEQAWPSAHGELAQRYLRGSLPHAKLHRSFHHHRNSTNTRRHSSLAPSKPPAELVSAHTTLSRLLGGFVPIRPSMTRLAAEAGANAGNINVQPGDSTPSEHPADGGDSAARVHDSNEAQTSTADGRNPPEGAAATSAASAAAPGDAIDGSPGNDGPEAPPEPPLSPDSALLLAAAARMAERRGIALAAPLPTHHEDGHHGTQHVPNTVSAEQAEHTSAPLHQQQGVRGVHEDETEQQGPDTAGQHLLLQEVSEAEDIVNAGPGEDTELQLAAQIPQRDDPQQHHHHHHRHRHRHHRHHHGHHHHQQQALSDEVVPQGDALAVGHETQEPYTGDQQEPVPLEAGVLSNTEEEGVLLHAGEAGSRAGSANAEAGAVVAEVEGEAGHQEPGDVLPPVPAQLGLEAAATPVENEAGPSHPESPEQGTPACPDDAPAVSSRVGPEAAPLEVVLAQQQPEACEGDASTFTPLLRAASRSLPSFDTYSDSQPIGAATMTISDPATPTPPAHSLADPAHLSQASIPLPPPMQQAWPDPCAFSTEDISHSHVQHNVMAELLSQALPSSHHHPLTQPPPAPSTSTSHLHPQHHHQGRPISHSVPPLPLPANSAPPAHHHHNHPQQHYQRAPQQHQHHPTQYQQVEFHRAPEFLDLASIALGTWTLPLPPNLAATSMQPTPNPQARQIAAKSGPQLASASQGGAALSGATSVVAGGSTHVVWGERSNNNGIPSPPHPNAGPSYGQGLHQQQSTSSATAAGGLGTVSPPPGAIAAARIRYMHRQGFRSPQPGPPCNHASGMLSPLPPLFAQSSYSQFPLPSQLDQASPLSAQPSQQHLHQNQKQHGAVVIAAASVQQWVPAVKGPAFTGMVAGKGVDLARASAGPLSTSAVESLSDLRAGHLSKSWTAAQPLPLAHQHQQQVPQGRIPDPSPPNHLPAHGALRYMVKCPSQGKTGPGSSPSGATPQPHHHLHQLHIGHPSGATSPGGFHSSPPPVTATPLPPDMPLTLGFLPVSPPFHLLRPAATYNHKHHQLPGRQLKGCHHNHQHHQQANLRTPSPGPPDSPPAMSRPLTEAPASPVGPPVLLGTAGTITAGTSPVQLYRTHLQHSAASSGSSGHYSLSSMPAVSDPYQGSPVTESGLVKEGSNTHAQDAGLPPAGNSSNGTSGSAGPVGSPALRALGPAAHPVQPQKSTTPQAALAGSSGPAYQPLGAPVLAGAQALAAQVAASTRLDVQRKAGQHKRSASPGRTSGRRAVSGVKAGGTGSHPPSPQLQHQSNPSPSPPAATILHAASDGNTLMTEKRYNSGVLVAYHSAQPETLQPMISASQEDLLMYSAPHDDLAPIFAAPSDFDSWPLYQQQRGLAAKTPQLGALAGEGGILAAAAHSLPTIARKSLQAPMVVRPLKSPSPGIVGVLASEQYSAGQQALHSSTQVVRLPLLNH